MKKEFKAGEKIAFYSQGYRQTDVIYRIGVDGAITTSSGYMLHPKQCRHLKPKRKNVCVALKPKEKSVRVTFSQLEDAYVKVNFESFGQRMHWAVVVEEIGKKLGLLP